ncbi:TonB-dependent siderophore receptor [Ancylobacter dichloromethanicus]|uniref:TonB-dependent receptor n=1 Tax=Ancylobacter dichloromethanicus TaxID=518825 RepID=A0A9W6J7A7_9HYPH|nr:TonB-dependent siderophore receptor [Ancylobacter dichloromethanicus]MBS7552757.1 TonB-dependent siderophore receptor [Ancylobacter dichloromethanicus]GLK72121.1 TonB-dependent receptor [Ancylobacter dichloromethanicus]
MRERLGLTMMSLLMGGTAAFHPAAARAQDAAAPIELEQIDIQGQRTDGTDGYVARSSTAGTKTDTPLIEVPQSISVVTRDQMEARAVQSVGQALDYTAGVLSQPFGTDPRFDSPIIRGFSADNSMYLNGLKLMREAGTPAIDPYGLERIDVVRGPASVLYGQGNPGGLLDFISKRPTFTTFGEVQAEAGSFDRYTGRFDIGGVLPDNADIAYRFTGVARDGGTQTDHVDDNRLFFAPALTWQPSTDTSLTVLANIQYDQSGTPVGLPVQYTVDADGGLRLPRSLFLGDPDYDNSNRTFGSVGYEFKHRFNETWEFRQNARYAVLDWDYNSLYYSALSTTDPLVAERGSSDNSEDQQTFNLDSQLLGKFDTGAFSHEVLIGVDYRRYSESNSTAFGTASPINILFPIYNQPVGGTPWYTADVDGTIAQTGIYAQDQIRLQNWLLTVGLRHDWANTDSTSLTNFGDTEQDQDDSAFTGRVGLTYLFDNGIAPYFNYSTSFEPVIGNMPTQLGGGAFQPMEGEQVEVGVKYQPVGWNGFFTLAAYDLTQSNVLSSQLIDGVSYETQLGEIRVRGFEFTAVAGLADGLNLIANYTYMNAEITEGEYAGNRPANVPENMANLWLDYTIPSGQLAGFGFGGGVRFVGDRYALDDNSIFLSSNTLFDAAIHYEKGPFKAQLNVNNIADETYVAGCGFFGCFYGDGRTVIGTLSYKW